MKQIRVTWIASLLSFPALSTAVAVIVLLPQASDTEPENVPDPTVIGTELAETVSMPLRPSVAVPLIDITSAMVLEPSAGELMSMAGSVRSMWMLLTVAVTDELPALSAQFEANCPKPSPEFVVLTVASTGPDVVSVHVQVAVTAELFQPLRLAAGRRLKSVIVGALSS